jgi:putative FmdB family regulatory protein
MPLYEYECDKCGHRFEKIRKFSDPPLEVCPKCGGPVHKLQSAPAFQFKGTGWYVTDYAKSGKSDTKETKSTPDSAKAESAKTDSTTPAPAKTDTKPGD